MVENNLAINLRVPMLSHMTVNCSFINNIFLDNAPQIVSVLNSFGLSFEKNILVAQSIEIDSPRGNSEGLPSEYDSHEYMKNYSTSDGIVSLKNNIFYTTDGQRIFKEFLHYKAIREFKLEEKDGNTFTDPLLKNPAIGDFSFELESPARLLGIQSLSFMNTGCTGSFPLIYDRFSI